MATLRIIVMLDDHEIATTEHQLTRRQVEEIAIIRNNQEAAKIYAVQLAGGVRLERSAKGQTIHEFVRE